MSPTNQCTALHMPYCNVWAKVVYCGFPKSKLFTKTLICLYIPYASPKSILSPPSFIIMWVYSGYSEIQPEEKEEDEQFSFLQNLIPFP